MRDRGKEGPGPREHDAPGKPSGPDIPSVRGGRPDPRHSDFPRPPFEEMPFFVPLFRGPFLGRMLIALLMFSFNIAVKLFFKSVRDQEAMKELEHNNLQTELDYLKYQINPHFFMNTLNNIHALVDIDTEKAKQTIVELSRLMRYVLYESNNRLISLSKELQFLNHYIELMRIRYTDKVRIDVSFPTDTGEVQVPPLLFVSFVENAFKHGVSYQHASFVSVCLQVVGEEIHFVCSNSNYYRSEDQHHGIGLDNIRKRLRLLFGERYKLSIDDTADCFDVQLLVPVS
jgi:LytS/YehU family sensor histidine kinase